MPAVDRVRLVNSGTEAAMSAIRLARGFTGRDGIIKFNGCYHGHADAFLIQAGSGALTLGQPSSPGVTEGAARDTFCAEYNDLPSVEAAFEAHPKAIAALIVEPVAGNMGMVPPEPGFLEGLRALCDRHGALLVFDEVITGFRVGPGGAQQRFGVTPDLAVFGKIIGGGLPVGAYGGREDVMAHVSPDGPVYQAGTLSGNPLAVAAGQAMLDVLTSEPVYERLEALGALLEAGIRSNLASLGLDLCATRVGSMSCLFFTEKPVVTFADAAGSDLTRFAAYFRTMLEEGIYLAPSQFETAFLSTAHSEDDVARIVAANRKALRAAYA